jgi:multicomponent Na+:H+ antiporter subunit B
MKTLILNTTNRFIIALLLVFSVFLLLRGHNLPGGGFSGGLVAGAAFALQAIGFGVPSARKLLLVDCRTLIAAGLAVALGSGLLSTFKNLPFMTGLWDKTQIPVIGKLGTPIFFDIGVYIVVLGVVSLIVFVLADDPEDPDQEGVEPWN